MEIDPPNNKLIEHESFVDDNPEVTENLMPESTDSNRNQSNQVDQILDEESHFLTNNSQNYLKRSEEKKGFRQAKEPNLFRSIKVFDVKDEVGNANMNTIFSRGQDSSRKNLAPIQIQQAGDE